MNEKSQHQQYEGLNKFSQNSVDFSYIPIEHESDDEFELATDQKTFYKKKQQHLHSTVSSDRDTKVNLVTPAHTLQIFTCKFRILRKCENERKMPEREDEA